jgi:hypothetical protein
VILVKPSKFPLNPGPAGPVAPVGPFPPIIVVSPAVDVSNSGFTLPAKTVF